MKARRKTKVDTQKTIFRKQKTKLQVPFREEPINRTNKQE